MANMAVEKVETFSTKSCLEACCTRASIRDEELRFDKHFELVRGKYSTGAPVRCKVRVEVLG